MPLPKIRIYNDDNGKLYPTHVEIDGQKIRGVRGINFHCSLDEIPTVELELVSLMDSGIDIDNAKLQITFSPQTVHEAMRVLGISGIYDENGDAQFLFDDGK